MCGDGESARSGGEDVCVVMERVLGVVWGSQVSFPGFHLEKH